MGGGAPQLAEGVGLSVELEDDVAGGARCGDVRDAVTVEVGDVGRTATSSAGERELGERPAVLAAEHVDLAGGDEHDLGEFVIVEVGDAAEAVGDLGVPKDRAGEVALSDRAGEGVGRLAADELGATVPVEVGDAGDGALAVATDAALALVEELAGGVVDGRAEDDLGVALVVEVGDGDRAAAPGAGEGIRLPQGRAVAVDRDQVLALAAGDDLGLAVAVDVGDGDVRGGVRLVGRIGDGPYLLAGVAAEGPQDAVGGDRRPRVGVEDDLRDAVVVEVGDDGDRRDLIVVRLVVVGGSEVGPGDRALAVHTDLAGLALAVVVAVDVLALPPGELGLGLEHADVGDVLAALVSVAGDAKAEVGIADKAVVALRLLLLGRAGDLPAGGAGVDAGLEVADLAVAAALLLGSAGRVAAAVGDALELVTDLVWGAAIVATGRAGSGVALRGGGRRIRAVGGRPRCGADGRAHGGRGRHAPRHGLGPARGVGPGLARRRRRRRRVRADAADGGRGALAACRTVIAVAADAEHGQRCDPPKPVLLHHPPIS